MMVSFKDGLKFIGISIVCFCAVFVCTFFLNYYIDILPLKDEVSAELMPLYTAQLATSKMTCGITGGFLSVIAIIMLFFYIKLYIDDHHKAIGTFKAMGYSNFKIAKSFIVFGFSVFVGCGLGFIFGWICMPYIYESLTIDGLPVITASFHIGLLICLVFVPTIVFTLISFLYTAAFLHRPALELVKGEYIKVRKIKSTGKLKDREFLKEMRLSTLKSKKMLVFFVAFSCFCFSAMVQMGMSMEDLVNGTMGMMILVIGLVLAAVSMFMAMTSLVKGNAKNIAVMKAMGFSGRERFTAIFSGYIPFVGLGFALGTVYQYGLLSLMINLIFKNVGEVPEYNFNVPVFFITLLLFSVSYFAVFMIYLYRANKVSVKEIMLED